MEAAFWVYIIQVVIIASLTFLLEMRFMKKGSPILVYITVYIGWFLGFIIIATLPFDIYVSSNFDTKNPTDQMIFLRDFTKWNWKILYAITFALTWFIFPLQMVYVVRGEFSRTKRMVKTLLENLISYLIYIVLGVGVLLLIFFLVNNKKKAKERVGMFDVVYVITTVYGLLLIVFLMSYGMVAVPKSLYQWSDYKSEINKELYQISLIEEKLNDLRMDLSSNINDLENLNSSSDMQPFLSIIREEISEFKKRNSKFEEESQSYSDIRGVDGSTGGDVDVVNVTLSKLEGYRSKYKIEFGDYERIHAMLEFNIRKVMDLQARINIRESSQLREMNLGGFQRVKFMYYIYIHPIALIFLALLTAIFSFALLYAELTNFTKIDISIFSWVVKGNLSFVQMFLLLSLPLGYMLACTYFGFFSVKLASWYELYKGHSDPVSMIWSGTILARLIYPMSYNFITIMKAPNTSYSQVLTILDDFTILGDGMNRYFFPVVLVLFFLLNLFNLWSRMFNALGLSQFSFDDFETESRIKEGRITVDQRRKELYKNGEIDEVFLKNSQSSDSDNDINIIGQKFSINSGIQGAVSPMKKRERGNSFKKGTVIKTKRNSFQLAVSDSDDSSQNDESGKKVINISGNLKFKDVE